MQIMHLRLDLATLSWFRQHFETDQAIKRLYMGPKNGENGIGRAIGLQLDGWRMGANVHLCLLVRFQSASRKDCLEVC